MLNIDHKIQIPLKYKSSFKRKENLETFLAPHSGGWGWETHFLSKITIIKLYYLCQPCP